MTLMLLLLLIQPPREKSEQLWLANATLANYFQATDPELGAAQGASRIGNKIYIYGDVWSAQPRCGIIKEYELSLKPTGRKLWLKKSGQPLLLHPTGLTQHPKLGVFVGDTVNKKGRIYLLDWERAWADGHLDHAIKAEIDDDAAHNGTRPCLVNFGGKLLLATADHDHANPDDEPSLRLYDPEALVAAGKSSAPGVLVHRCHCGYFTQNLHWDDQRQRLTFIQNIYRGKGWQLEDVDLAKAIKAGRTESQGVVQARLRFNPHDELEGFVPLGDGRSLLVTASKVNNLTVGKVELVPPKPSPPGTMKP